jgi:hypothetical protein
MSKVDHEFFFLLQLTILTMRATNIKATRGAVATKAVAVGGRACARARALHNEAELLLVLPKSLAVTRIYFFMVYLRHYFNCSTLVSYPFFAVIGNRILYHFFVRDRG